MAITIRMLGREDEAVLSRVNPDVFDGPVRPELVEEFLGDPRHHIAVAINEEGIVIGMASGVHFIHPDKPPQLFVNEVGVADAWHNQGLGHRLLLELLAHGKKIGCAEAWVATEQQNAPARALYRKAGGEEAPESIVMYTFEPDRY